MLWGLMAQAPAPDSTEVLARIEEGLPLVEILAHQMRRQTGGRMQVDDLASTGREALLHAARSFDASRGVPFRRWANLRIRGALIDSVRAQGGLPRRVYAKLKAMAAADHAQEGRQETDAAAEPASPEAADARLQESLAGAAAAMAMAYLTMGSMDEEGVQVPTHAPTPEAQTASKELLAQITSAIDERPEAERQLLRRHYFDDVTFEQAAAELGLSKSWASRLHARAIEGIAKRLRREGVDP
jgi:RNA polymerase sigma factor for flagellar operon FliA